MGVGETHLSVQNDAPLPVNPQILLHQPTIFLREETVRGADEAVGRRHSYPGTGLTYGA